MADTGAPYFLPYPEPTDLVRDGADAIKDLAEALAQALEDIPVTQKKVAAFTGDGTWTVPAGVTYAIAYVLGGGGAGSRNNVAGNAGGFSRVAFASGNVDSLGGLGAAATAGGFGGTGPQANSGLGSKGPGSGYDATLVAGGAAVTPASSIAVTVGAGGTGGDGLTGGSGYVWIEYFEEV